MIRSVAARSLGLVAVLVALCGALLLATVAGHGVRLDDHRLLDAAGRAALYGFLALVLALCHRSVGVANLAVGDMDAAAVFVAWSLLVQAGLDPWVGLAGALGIAVLWDAVAQRGMKARSDPSAWLVLLIVLVGLFELLDRVSEVIRERLNVGITAPFGSGAFDVPNGSIDAAYAGAGAVLLLLLGLSALLFGYTRLGLASRATSDNALAARLYGAPSRWRLWAARLAATLITAGVGLAAANAVNLDPHQPVVVALYVFAGALLGGLDSPIGACAGGVVMGAVHSVVAGSDLPRAIPDITLAALIVLMLATRVVTWHRNVDRPADGPVQ